MIKDLSWFLLLSCTTCAGQSILTTPGEVTQSSPANVQAPASATQAQDESLQLDRGAAVPVAPVVSHEEPPKETHGATRIAGPLKEKSEFEQFAEDTTGRPLPVYGRQLFDQVPTTFAPVEHIPVPSDYVIGPGDELLIRAWGKIELDSRVTVDRNGQINLPRVGTLTVAGIRYDQLESFLRSAIGALFKDFELNVTLGQLRSMEIVVLGDARQPGVYTVSSLSTLVNALFASGGPSANGSMRDIQLKRDGKILTEFDIYDLIRHGDKSRDLRLLPGDIIYIPPVGPQVAISGDVSQPGIYELKGETTVGAALNDAGGMTNLADARRVVLERIENHSSRMVEEFALDSSGLARVLGDGDLLRVFPLSPKFQNAVTLRGNVAQPGTYVWKEGMRVSDLIPSRSFLITRSYWNVQNHLVQPGADHPFGDPTNLTAKTDASIGQNNAEINWDYALIERLDERDLSTLLIPFHLGNALDNPASPDNKQLQAGDVVTIFSRADLELPMEKHALFVRVGGEVNAPGVYRIKSGDTLRDVVRVAGGLTPHSYLYAAVFTRVSARVAQENQLKQATDEMQNELISRFANAAPQVGQTAADQQAQLAIQETALARLAAVKPTGRVVLEMRPSATISEDIPEFPLEDGDSFYIPPRLSTVQVAGAVYNANSFRYASDERLIAYLNLAGGPTREADSKRIFVIRADGSVVSRQSRNDHSHGRFDNLKLLPGDAIIVPQKLRTSNKMVDLLQTTQFASQTALTAAALSVIR